MDQHYNDYGTWIRRKFPFRVQKISIDGGFSCPNRDGRISFGGCTYCDNRTFNPAYCDRTKSVAEQIREGKAFFARKYPDMKYLAYFQSFTNTYAPTDKLQRLYEEALAEPDIVGIVIGTRPDCISDALLDYLEELNRRTFVIVEYGIESTNDDTLRHINRGHDFACSRKAIPPAGNPHLRTCDSGTSGRGRSRKPAASAPALCPPLRHPQDTPDADHTRYRTGTPIHPKTVSCVQRGRIHHAGREIHPASEKGHRAGTICKPIACRFADSPQMGTEKS